MAGIQELHEVNGLFQFTQLFDEDGRTDCVEDGLELVMRDDVVEAIEMAKKILSDKEACKQIYGPLGALFHQSITSEKVLEIIEAVKVKNFYVTVQDDSAMTRAYMQCLPYPNDKDPSLDRPMLMFNEKYSKKTKNSDQQIYFLVCKILHEIGHFLTPGLFQSSPDYVPGTKYAMSEKVGTNILPGNEFAADCGAAVEEIAFGGRVMTANDSAQPFRDPLKLVVRKFNTLPPGPGNYTIYRINPEYVTKQVATLRRYIKEDGPLPDLRIPADARPEVLASNTTETADQARERMLGKKSKRSALDEAGGEEESEADPEFDIMVANGIAFSAAQKRKMDEVIGNLLEFNVLNNSRRYAP